MLNDYLLLAANVGRHTDVALALMRGADAEAWDDDGHAVIHLAALSNNPLTIEPLLEKGIDLEVKNDDRLTAFQLAVEEHKMFTAFFLAEKGSDVDALWADGASVLHKCVERDWHRLLTIALERSDAHINRKNAQGMTPAQLASTTDRSTCLQILLEHGASQKGLRGPSNSKNVEGIVMAWKAGQAIEILLN